MHAQGQLRQMGSVSRHISEMAREAEHRPRHLDFFISALLNITEEENDLTQFLNQTLHSDILRIGWPSIILSFISKYLARTQQTYLTHIGSNNGTQTGHPNHHTNLETHLRPMDQKQ